MSPDTLGQLLQGVLGVTWQSLTMVVVGLVLVWLAVARQYEPLLLLPIGAGSVLANLPLSPLVAEGARSPSCTTWGWRTSCSPCSSSSASGR